MACLDIECQRCGFFTCANSVPDKCKCGSIDFYVTFDEDPEWDDLSFDEEFPEEEEDD